MIISLDCPPPPQDRKAVAFVLFIPVYIITPQSSPCQQNFLLSSGISNDAGNRIFSACVNNKYMYAGGQAHIYSRKLIK